MAKMKRETKAANALELSSFCAEVALMLSSGMALYDGMEALNETYKNSPHADLYASISQGVTKTGSLYVALKQDGRWPEYLVEMVGIGERTGRLEDVMNGLAEYYERESRIRQAIVSAITYPVVLGVMMLLIVLIMILLVLPVFQRVLGSMGVAMSASGQLMMNLGSGIGWTMLALVSVVVLLVLVLAALTKTRHREKVLNMLRRVFTPIRELSRKLASSRVASVLSMMLSGGFPLEEALELVIRVLDDPTAVAEVTQISQKMAGGTAFSDALTGTSLFDEMYNRMIRMGVAAGREDQVMARIARVYEEQVEDDIARLVSIIEPTLVAMLSIVIGAILLSVMLPMAGIIASIL